MGAKKRRSKQAGKAAALAKAQKKQAKKSGAPLTRKKK